MSVPPALMLTAMIALAISAPASAAAVPPNPAPSSIAADTAKTPVAAPLPPDSAMLRTTRNAIMGLNAGHLLTTASLWTIPGIYDIGILAMMGSKKTLKKEYVKRYHEEPMEFGQTGDNAYWQGWAMKGGAVISFIVLANKEPVWGVAGFAILWLGGTFKHYEASRMLYEQSRHYENGILDENPPMTGQAFPGQGEAGGRERFILRISTAF
jgi:hypothetical protein